MQHRDEPTTYEIRVRGHLGDTLRCAFPRLEAAVQGGDTLLAGVLPDQAALHGVLTQIEALGLELIAVRRMTTDRPRLEQIARVNGHGNGRSPSRTEPDITEAKHS